MFAKTFLLVLLGTTLVLASPVENVGNYGHTKNHVRVSRSILAFIAELLVKTDNAVDSIFNKVKQPFKKVYNVVVETSGGVVDYGKGKAQQVLDKYYEIKSKSEDKLNEVKNMALTKVINELQNVIDKLTKGTDDETLEKLKEKTQNIADSSKDALEKLQKQLQEAIDAEKQKLEQNLNEWENEANSVVKKGH